MSGRWEAVLHGFAIQAVHSLHDKSGNLVLLDFFNICTRGPSSAVE